MGPEVSEDFQKQILKEVSNLSSQLASFEDMFRQLLSNLCIERPFEVLKEGTKLFPSLTLTSKLQMALLFGSFFYRAIKQHTNSLSLVIAMKNHGTFSTLTQTKFVSRSF